MDRKRAALSRCIPEPSLRPNTITGMPRQIWRLWPNRRVFRPQSSRPVSPVTGGIDPFNDRTWPALSMTTHDCRKPGIALAISAGFILILGDPSARKRESDPNTVT